MDYIAWEKMLMPPLTGWMLWAKIFFILFNVGVVVFIVYVWTTTIYVKRLFGWDLVEFFTYRAFTARNIDKDWIKIKKRLLKKNEAEFKLAVIEADILVNDVLARANYEGANLAEKLDKKPGAFSDIDGMRAADQVYLDIVNDPSYSLEYSQAKGVILAFERCLKEVSAFTEK